VVTGQDATAFIHEAMPLCATLGIRAEKYSLVAKVTQTQMVLRPRG
jgi:hypothetical protein